MTCVCETRGTITLCSKCGATLNYEGEAAEADGIGAVARVGHAVSGELTSHAHGGAPGHVAPVPSHVAPAAVTPRNDRPRRLLTRTEIAALRSALEEFEPFTSADVYEVLAAYETAVRLLEEVVRQAPERDTSRRAVVTAADIACLMLREAER